MKIYETKSNDWRSTWYLCESEKEYTEKQREISSLCSRIQKERRIRGCSDNQLPKVLDETTLHAEPFYYGHEWHGREFYAIGFAYRDTLCRESRYFLKPGTIKYTGQNAAEMNKHCAGIYEGT